MEALYVGKSGKVELRFWQEKLVNSFLKSQPSLNLSAETLVEGLRDGSEMMYNCPVDQCWGNVACTDRSTDEWMCGECGEVWKGRTRLLEAIQEA